MAYVTTGVSTQAQDLAGRIDALHQNGYGWMDPTLQVHLAQNGGSTQNMLNYAAIYQSVSNVNSQSPSNSLSDPHLNNTPSPIQKAFSYAHNIVGPVPVLHNDVTNIQNQMQNLGYGASLPLGVWNQQWQAAFRSEEHTSELQSH